MQQAPAIENVQRPTPVPAQSAANPAQVLEGLKEQHSELRNQLERLESQRENMIGELPGAPDAVKKSLEARIATIDGRIVELDKAIADNERAVAQATAVPGAVVPEPPEPPRSGPPEEFFAFLMVLSFVVLLPLSIAYARRIWRRGAQVVSAIPSEIYDRFNRVDQAIDSIAVEVERIGEGQRYLTRTLAEQQKSLGAGAAEPLQQKAREEQQARR